MNNNNNDKDFPKKVFGEDTLKPKTEISSQNNVTENKEEGENKTPSNRGLIDEIDELLEGMAGQEYGAAEEDIQQDFPLHEAEGEGPAPLALRDIIQQGANRRAGRNETPKDEPNSMKEFIEKMKEEDKKDVAYGETPRGTELRDLQNANLAGRYLRNIAQPRANRRAGENETPSGRSYLDEINEVLGRNNEGVHRAVAGNMPMNPLMQEAGREYPLERVLRDLYQPGVNEGERRTKTPSSDNQIINNEPDDSYDEIIENDSYDESLKEDEKEVSEDKKEVSEDKKEEDMEMVFPRINNNMRMNFRGDDFNIINNNIEDSDSYYDSQIIENDDLYHKDTDSEYRRKVANINRRLEQETEEERKEREEEIKKMKDEIKKREEQRRKQKEEDLKEKEEALRKKEEALRKKEEALRKREEDLKKREEERNAGANLNDSSSVISDYDDYPHDARSNNDESDNE